MVCEAGEIEIPAAPGSEERGDRTKRGSDVAMMNHRTVLRARDSSESVAAPPLPPNASVGKRWRFRRNAVIYVAHRGGLSQRLLADVFDLPRSRIADIIRDFRRFDGDEAGEKVGPIDR